MHLGLGAEEVDIAGLPSEPRSEPTWLPAAQLEGVWPQEPETGETMRGVGGPRARFGAFKLVTVTVQS